MEVVFLKQSKKKRNAYYHPDGKHKDTILKMEIVKMIKQASLAKDGTIEFGDLQGFYNSSIDSISSGEEDLEYDLVPTEKSE